MPSFFVYFSYFGDVFTSIFHVNKKNKTSLIGINARILTETNRDTLCHIFGNFCQITIKRMKKKKKHTTQIASVTKHFHKRVFTLHVMNAQLLLDKEAEANKLSITIVNGLLRSILLTSFWKIKHFAWMKVIWNTIVSLIFFHLCSFFSISSLCAVSRSVCMANRLSSGKLFCQSDHRYYCRQRSLHLCNIRFNPFKII